MTFNAFAASLVLRRELAGLPPQAIDSQSLPAAVVAFHVLFLAGVVVFAHHPPVFLGLLPFFLGLAVASPQFQDRLMLREGLLVGFFLAGLVMLDPARPLRRRSHHPLGLLAAALLPTLVAVAAFRWL